MITDLLAELNADDWLVSNMIQCDDGTWLVHLRQGMMVTEHGSGATLEEALVAAMAKRDKPKYYRLTRFQDGDYHDTIRAGSLLERLGLAAPVPKLRRI